MHFHLHDYIFFLFYLKPPLKKLKTEDLNGIQMKPGGVQQSLDDGTVILESGRRTLYTPSGVSRWNQCKYECCFCKRTTMSRSSMTSHIHNTHGIPIKVSLKAGNHVMPSTT